MRRSRRPIRIAARPSRLSRAQAEMIGAALAKRHPDLAIEYTWITSEGDQITDGPLAPAGGKGLFTRAIEHALLDGRADLAIHSLKDLPTDSTPGLTLAAVPARADVRDCLVAHDPAHTSIESLPHGAVVGTASPRRAAQVLHLRPDLHVEIIRGNVETRVRKVADEKRFDATLMAVAGLQRAGLGEHAGRPIDPAVILPAACQGALGVQCRSDDHVSITRCLPLNDGASAAAVHAERQVVDGLNGDCNSPIAVLTEFVMLDGKLAARLRIRVLSLDGREMLEFDQTTTPKGLGKLAKAAVKDMRGRGADTLLQGMPKGSKEGVRGATARVGS